MKLKISFFILLFFSFKFVVGQTSSSRHPAEWEEISAEIMEFRYFKNPNVSWNEAIDPFVKTAQACVNEGIDFYIIKPSNKNNQYNIQVDLDTVFKHRNIISPLVHIISQDSILDSFPWVRDHGMNLVYKNKIGKRYLLNFPDDHTGKFIAKYMGISEININPKIKEKYYTDGGNFLTDGHGTFNLAATLISENMQTGLLNKYDYFYKYFGIKKTLNIPSTFVHVDYFLKLIDEETAIIAFIPNNNYDISIDKFFDDQYYIDQAVILITQQLKSVYNRDIKFIPIQNAPTTYDKNTGIILHTSKASYTNSVILNKTVLVPQYKIEPFDELAISAYKKAMPGYKIVGVNCREYGQLSGAIHCLTHEIYTNDPIYIKHKWYKGIVKNNLEGYPINVIAKSSTGIKKAVLYWKTNKDTHFNSQPMNNYKKNNFYTVIPKAKSRTIINYYIEVYNNNGKVIDKPMVAPKHSYSFTIQ